MRQRGVKRRDEKLEKGAAWIVEDPAQLKGSWRSSFAEEKPLFCEIGSGKGRFIVEMAKAHPENNYIAVEGSPNINVRIVQKCAEEGLDNIKVVMVFAHDVREWFETGELDGIFLNFSDPWPKKCHAKRRLTHRNMILAYKDVLAKEGVLQFKTDNDGLFDFSLEELEALKIKPFFVSRDFHNSPEAFDNIMTEYEEKFSSTGKTINCLRIKL